MVPPLLGLAFYTYPVRGAPSIARLLWLFGLGMIAGGVSLSLAWGFEQVAEYFFNWQRLTRSLPGAALRQLLEVAPIEEGCKFLTVLLATRRLRQSHRLVPLPPSIVFLSAIAVAMGFTAEENLVYLFNGTALIFDRVFGTPVHALFAAPWGYALALSLDSSADLSSERTSRLFRAWLDGVVCHALVNLLGLTWNYPLPLRLLNNGQFPFLLWLFWRTDRRWRRSQGLTPPRLISGSTVPQRYWQRGLALLSLMLGGYALFGCFLLGRSFSQLSPTQVWQAPPEFWQFVASRLLPDLMLAAIATGIYRYLRHCDRLQ